MLVNESIEDILKGKSEHEINSQIDLLIDKFVSEVSIKDLKRVFKIEKYFGNDAKILTKEGKTVFLTSYNTFFSIVDSLISDYDEFNDKRKYPEISNFWIELNLNIRTSAKNYEMFINRVMEKIAAKFNVEY